MKRQIEVMRVLDLQEKNKLIITKDIFRAYDIRGVYPEQINEDVYKIVGKAIGTYINNQNAGTEVCLCADGRLSSPTLKKSLMEGLISTGIDVVDIGLLPTPLLNYSLKNLNIKNGLMITGSHNPKNYNGIKMVVNNITLYGEYIKEIFEIADKGQFLYGQKGSIKNDSTILESYITKLIDTLDIDFNHTVSIDCGNGITGNVVRKIFDALKIKTKIINEKVDGNFPNHSPNPSDEKNLVELKKILSDSDSMIGFAYDGDGDRIAAVRKNGKVLWPDQLMIIFSKSILNKYQGAKIVYDIKCSKHLEKEIIKNGGVPILCRTGHSFIKKAIIDNQAALGGELSGHIFFADKWDGFDDGIYSSLRLLEILGKYQNIDEPLDKLPNTVITPEINIEFKGNNHFTFMELFVKLAKFENASIINIDGMKIIFENGWALIRCSNTSANLVLRFEADDGKSLRNIKNLVQEQINKVDDKIKINIIE